MHASACRTTKKVPRSRSSLGRRAPARGLACDPAPGRGRVRRVGRCTLGLGPRVRWPRVSRGGRLVTEVRRQRQSSSPPRPFQRPDRSLKADWLDERPTSNGAVRERVEPAHLGGRWFGADGPPSPPPSPRDLQRCLKVRQVRHRAPPRYTKCACGRTLKDHRSPGESPHVMALGSPPAIPPAGYYLSVLDPPVRPLAARAAVARCWRAVGAAPALLGSFRSTRDTPPLR